MAEAIGRRLFLIGGSASLLLAATRHRWVRRFGRYTGYRGGYRG